MRFGDISRNYQTVIVATTGATNRSEQRRNGMATKTFGEELSGELAVKAIMWVPSIAGAILLGPLGVLFGLATSVAIVASVSDSPPPSGEQSKAAGS
jgi:hypothetical protein